MLAFKGSCLAAILFTLLAPVCLAQESASLDPLVVTSTRQETTATRSPASVTVITSEELANRQILTVADALRGVPGIDVNQSGAPGQLTSVFVRGLSSEATQVLIDGVPVNQGLAGLFNFADLTTENIERIEVVRGPQSSLFGPRAGGGVVNIITRSGGAKPASSLTLEGGSFGTFRETASTAGTAGPVDYLVSLHHLDTDNDRPNNQYRYTSGTAKIGWQAADTLRLSTLFLYSLADASGPGSVSDVRPFDNLLTERWLVAPKVEFDPTPWWHHQLTVAIDHERQVSDPSFDGFVGPTRAVFKRWQVDYQNVIDAAEGVEILSGYFYSRFEADQEQPFISFGPPFISDRTENHAAFLQFEFHPVSDLTLVASGRFDHFSQSGDILTYRLAGNYLLGKTGTIFHASLGTGFSPATSQDKIYGNNPNLDPNETKGWDVGIEQSLIGKSITVGVTYFQNEASNVIGFNNDFATFNLGSARTEGLESFLRWSPLPDLNLSLSHTYLDAKKTSNQDIQQPDGARLARRPRHHFSGAISYRWFHRLRTGLELESVSGREELNFGAANFDVEDYTTLRFTAAYDLCENVQLTARIENLLDEDHVEVFGYPSLGRGYYGGVTVKF